MLTPALRFTHCTPKHTGLHGVQITNHPKAFHDLHCSSRKDTLRCQLYSDKSLVLSNTVSFPVARKWLWCRNTPGCIGLSHGIMRWWATGSHVVVNGGLQKESEWSERWAKPRVVSGGPNTTDRNIQVPANIRPHTTKCTVQATSYTDATTWHLKNCAQEMWE